MSRLAQGVRKREDGRYEIRFTYNGIRYSAYGNSSKDCITKQRDMINQIEEGLYIKNANITVEKLIEEYLETKSRTVKDSTLVIIKSIFNKHITPTFKKYKIKDIESRQVESWFRKLTKELSPSICNTTLGYLRELFEYAKGHSIISKNPCDSINSIKVNKSQATKTKHRALTDTELNIFLEGAKNHPYYEFYAFMVSTGCRVGEVACLTWKDIDYTNNVIHINKTIVKNNRQSKSEPEYIIGDTTKSESSIRDIPLTDSIKNILTSQKNKMKDLYGNIININGIIFKAIRGEYIVSKTSNNGIKTILNDLDQQGHHIEYFSSHAFRDTFATRFIENGGSPKVLQELLGHGSFAMTMDLYAQVMDDKKNKEMNQFANVINF